RVLARVPNGDRWIETLTRRGYRFVGPVARPPDKSPPPSVGVALLASGSAQHATHPTALPIAATPPNNIPARVSAFIGRTRETGEIQCLITHNRLVTLLGIGGVGKTRVALQVAAEVIERYRDGVWLVELGNISDARLVPNCVAEVLGIQDRVGEALVRTLGRHLKARQVLLVLDTCEHVIAAAASLAATLLAEAPDSRVLATTPERLAVDA